MIRNLRLFKITSDLDQLEIILEHFLQLHCVEPVKAENFISQVRGLTALPKDNPWQVVTSELEQIEKISMIHIHPKQISALQDAYDSVSQYIHMIHDHFKILLKQKEEALQLINKYEDALTQTENISTLDVDIDDIFSCKYINTRFGKMPLESLETLKLYEHKPILFQQFKQTKNFCWCMYMTTEENEREIDNIFSSMFFERIYIPDFVHGTPEDAKSRLMDEIKLAKENLNDILKDIGDYVLSNKEKLEFIKGELNLINRVNTAKQYVVCMGDKFSVTGFIHKSNIEMLQDKFKGLESVEIDIVPANLDKRLTPPRRIRQKCRQQKHNSS